MIFDRPDYFNRRNGSSQRLSWLEGEIQEIGKLHFMTGIFERFDEIADSRFFAELAIDVDLFAHFAKFVKILHRRVISFLQHTVPPKKCSLPNVDGAASPPTIFGNPAALENPP
jgi:hypothetical protein